MRLRSVAERSLLDSEMEHYDHMVRSNLTTAFVMAKAFVPAMRDAGRGRVVFFASAGVESQVAFTRAPIYYAVNAALVVMARALAKEIAPSGVTVNVISPGIIRHASSHKESQERMAPKVPLGRVGQVSDVIGALRWLLSSEGGYTTGTNITIDGGLSL